MITVKKEGRGARPLGGAQDPSLRCMPKRIDHVAIIVHSLEQALLFYRDTLGITPSEIKEVPTEQVRIAFLPLGGPGGSVVRACTMFAWKSMILMQLYRPCGTKVRLYWINNHVWLPRGGRFSCIPKALMVYCLNYWNVKIEFLDGSLAY